MIASTKRSHADRRARTDPYRTAGHRGVSRPARRAGRVRRSVSRRRRAAGFDALTRLRPLAVILIDAEMTAARSDLFFALASRKQIGVAVFGSGNHAREIAEIAVRRQIPWLTLPPDVERLTAVIYLLWGKKTASRQRDRRGPAETVVSPDGTCILRDTSGRHWIVYDRRSATDRRINERGEIGDRVFVAEDGETRHCELPAGRVGRTRRERLGGATGSRAPVRSLNGQSRRTSVPIGRTEPCGEQPYRTMNGRSR